MSGIKHQPRIATAETPGELANGAVHFALAGVQFQYDLEAEPLQLRRHVAGVFPGIVQVGKGFVVVVVVANDQGDPLLGMCGRRPDERQPKHHQQSQHHRTHGSPPIAAGITFLPRSNSTSNSRIEGTGATTACLTSDTVGQKLRR